MTSTTLFVDSSKLDLSEYQRGRNEITVMNYQPGIGTISTVHLSSLLIANYLLDDNSVSLSMSDMGDVDDKADVKKVGDDFLFSSCFCERRRFLSD